MTYAEFNAQIAHRDLRFWHGLVRSTSPIDREASGAAIAQFHAAAGLPTPQVIFAESPLAMVLAGGMATGLRRLCHAGAVHYEMGYDRPTAVRGLEAAVEVLDAAAAKLKLTDREGSGIGSFVLAATKAVTFDLRWPAANWTSLEEAIRLLGDDLRHMADGLIIGKHLGTDDPTPVPLGPLSMTDGRMRVVRPTAYQPAMDVYDFYGPASQIANSSRDIASTLLRRARAMLPGGRHRPPVYDHAAYLLWCAANCLDQLSDEDWGLCPAYEAAEATRRICLADPHERNLAAWEAHHAMALNAGAMFLGQEFCIIADRPAELHFVGEGRRAVLHNEEGPAIRYRDGVQGWCINGVRLPYAFGEQIVLYPGTQTLQEIDDEPNEEAKRVRIERFGWMRFLAEAGATIAERRDNDVEATREMLCRRGEMNVLVCHCPSTGRVYGLEVPAEITTCEQAQNWLWATDQSPYGPARIIGRS